MRLFQIIGFALALAFAGAYAQSPGSGPNVYNGGYYQSPFYSSNGHFQFGGALVPPAVSTCGTGPSVVVGTDSAFQFTTGTSAGGVCTITPAVAYKARPICNIDTGNATKPGYVVSTAGVIVMSSVQDSSQYNVICFAQPGGL